MLQESCSPCIDCCTSACRPKNRQILGVDLRRWSLAGIIAILVILVIGLAARLRGAQPRALLQVQVQGVLFSVVLLQGLLLAMLQRLVDVIKHLCQRSAASTGWSICSPALLCGTAS